MCILRFVKQVGQRKQCEQQENLLSALVFDEGQFITQVTLVKAWNQRYALIWENRGGLACCLKNSVSVLIYLSKFKEVIA